MEPITKTKVTARVTTLYMFFGILFTTVLLVANIIATKQVQLGPWTVTAGVLCFPISYILSDVVAEVYGFVAARRIIWIAFTMNLLMVIIFMLAIAWPAPVWYENGEAFATTLGSTPRLLIASLIAYLIGSWANAAIISKMKVAQQGKSFGVRAVVSTIAGELLDSMIFLPIAFLGVIPLEALPMMVVIQVMVKTMYEVIALPLTSFIVRKVKEYEQLDTFDHGVKRSLV